MLVYGIPLVPGNLSGTMLRMSDRFMLIHLSTPRDLGLYSYGYSFASLLNTLVILPFFLSFNPMRWEIHARGDARRIFSILHRAIVIGLVCMYIIFVPLVTLLGTFMSRNREFLQGLSVVPIIAFSYLLFGVYYFTQMGLLFEKRTLLISVLLLASSAIGLGLNLFLIPAFGSMGAAFSSVISHVTLLYSGSVLSQRYYPIPIDRRMQLMALTLAGGFCTMTCLCGMHTHLLQMGGGALGMLLLFLGLMALRYRHIPPWIFDTPRQICSIFRRTSQA
jgi:O-antigen/teichoic acid export membrane protein